MKLKFQALTLLLIRKSFSIPMQGVPADALDALGRSTVSAAEHLHPAPISAASHSMEVLTVDQVKQVLRFYKNQDLAGLLNKPEIAHLLKDKQNANRIYQEVEGFADEHIRLELKILSSAYKFPDNAEEMAKIVLPVRLSETANVLARTPEFQRMTDDLRALQNLIFSIRREKTYGGPSVWDPYYEELNTKFHNLVLKAATDIPTPPYFARKLQDKNYARFIFGEFKQMKGKFISPLAAALVREAAYNPVIAKMSTAKNMDEFVQLVRVFRDDDVLNLIEDYKVYKSVIQDPFKAFQLKSKVVGSTWDQSPEFFKKLRQASVRQYGSVQEVLVSLRDLRFATTDSDLTKFRPYNDFINNPGNAKKILTAIESAPSTYAAFVSNKLVFDTLKAKAYQELLPAPGSTADQIALSYQKLLQVGATRDFEKNEVYKNFIGKGDAYKLALLRQMEKLKIRRDDSVFSSLEGSLIAKSVTDLLDGKLHNAFLEEYLTTSEEAEFLYKRITANGHQFVILDELKKVNPKFIERLQEAAGITSKQ